MPSNLKRINLTVPDDVYAEILEYKQAQSIMSDASACLQLIKQQLKAQKESAAMMELINKLTADQLIKLSAEGVAYAKEVFDKKE